MRRLVGIASMAALAGALLFGVAEAAVPAAPSLDLRAQLFLRLFGETGDGRATVAAVFGDRSSESFLRGLALDPSSSVAAAFAGDAPMVSIGAIASGAPAVDLAAIAASMHSRFEPSVAPESLDDAPAVAATADARAQGSTTQTFTVGAYQPAAPAPAVSPQPGAYAFGPLTAPANGFVPAHSSALSVGAVSAGAQQHSALVPQLLHVGPAQFQVRVEGDSVQLPQAALDDAGYGAGANFDVRAGGRNVNVDVSSSVEHLERNDATGAAAQALGTNSTWMLPGDTVPLTVPNYAQMNKVAVGAAVAVPVVKGLTLNLNYDASRELGEYGLPGVSNVDAFDNSYGGGLTFSIPRFSSTLSLSARQLHYQDNILPLNSATTTRADLNLTVKF
ncbi:MAG TPA: hypothetical protein VMF61_07025 [Candidatus Acidoferrales bacterium]|nr:hypothetical protein [Candidatus Acidoferrales bacterium]